MEKKNRNRERKIVFKDFYGEGRHIYEDMLGWGRNEKREARSFVSKKIFEFEVVRVGLNLAFYYLDNDTFYGLHTERFPIEFKILPRDRSKPYTGWQCEGDTHDDGEVLYSFDALDMRIWDTIKIDGKSLEEVLERSFIVLLN